MCWGDTLTACMLDKACLLPRQAVGSELGRVCAATDKARG
jgi:hypothetical protein